MFRGFNRHLTPIRRQRFQSGVDGVYPGAMHESRIQNSPKNTETTLPSQWNARSWESQFLKILKSPTLLNELQKNNRFIGNIIFLY